MDVSIFLAKVIGLYCAIIGIGMIVRPGPFRDTYSMIEEKPAALTVIGMFTLILGLLLVVSHNIWVAGWPVVITMLAWLTLISGIARSFFAAQLLKLTAGMLSSKVYYPVAIVTLLVGLFLSYHGFCGGRI